MKLRKKVAWCSPNGVLKFNADGAACKQGSAGMGGVLRNHREVLFMFSKYVKVEGSNKVKALAILEVFDCIHVPSKTV